MSSSEPMFVGSAEENEFRLGAAFRPGLDAEELVKAFRCELAPGRIGFLHALMLPAATLLMMLLPLVYAGIAAGVAYTVWVFVFHTEPELVDGMPSLRTFSYWFAPIFAGTVVFIYMIKPLFARAEQTQADRMGLYPEEHPAFHELLKRLCQTLGAPWPRRILLDCQPRISAHTRAGLGGTFLRRGLELEIGLPLLASLSAPQLAGVLAHALYPYRKGWAACLGQIIIRLLAWLEGIVAYRDSFDDVIDEMCKSPVKLLRPLGYGTYYTIWLGRGVLRSLFLVARAISHPVTRHEQYLADRFGASVAGNLEYTSMLNQLAVAEFASTLSERDLQASIEKEALVANLPEFILAKQHLIPEGVRKRVQQAALSPAQELFSPLCTRGPRIHKLMARRIPGALRLERPAMDLLNDFDQLCLDTTIRHYMHLFGPDYQMAILGPTDQYLTLYGMQPRQAKVDEHQVEEHWFDRVMKVLATVGAILFTVSMLVHAGARLVDYQRESRLTQEEKYRRFIGRSLSFGSLGERKILDVVFLREGEIVGYRKLSDLAPDERDELSQDLQEDSSEGASSDRTRIPVKAPKTGWYYDTGDAWIAPCAEHTRPKDFLPEDE